MRALILPRDCLNERYISYVTERVAASEHDSDNGPCKFWGFPSYFPNLYAIIETQLNVPIGILYAGGPPTNIDAAWWLDSLYRGKGYASEAVELFAEYLRCKGVTGVNRIVVDTFQGKYNEESSKLCRRFKAHFP